MPASAKQPPVEDALHDVAELGADEFDIAARQRQLYSGIPPRVSHGGFLGAAGSSTSLSDRIHPLDC